MEAAAMADCAAPRDAAPAVDAAAQTHTLTPPHERLARARDIAASSELSEREKQLALREILRELNPSRRRVARTDGSMTNASHACVDDLVRAVETEVAQLPRTDLEAADPYKRISRMFRLTSGAAAAGREAVRTEADAVRLGALDFGPDAIWRRDSVLQEQLGILEVLPPLPEGDDRLGPNADPTAFNPRGGIYALRHAPGFYILPGALDVCEQEYWIARILRAYIEPPNRRNIDANIDPDYSNLTLSTPFYSVAGRSKATGGYGTAAAPHPAEVSLLPEVVALPRADGEAAHAPAFARDLWQRYVQECAAAAREGREPRGTDLDKLAWATLGYQYDWTARSYHVPSDTDYELHARVHARIASHDVVSGADASSAPSNPSPAPGPLTADAHPTEAHRWYAPYPEDIGALSASIASAVHTAVTSQCERLTTECGIHEPSALGMPMSIRASSGICNFYSTNSRQPMGLHVDDMERDYSHPVVSLSFGCTGVFLIGDAKKQMPPSPVLLRSGDISILSGATRLAFHGVARILSDTSPPALFCEAGTWQYPGRMLPPDEDERKALRRYTASARININVRQVL